VTDNDQTITPKEHSNDMKTPKDRKWVLVPLIAFGGVIMGGIVPSLRFIAGTGGCLLASILLAYLALLKPKKDIVSLLTPLYAVLILFNDSFDPTLLLPIQALYAASITILVLRLNARFSRKDEVQRRFTEEEEEDADEQIPE
jgi:hypothetical protein